MGTTSDQPDQPLAWGHALIDQLIQGQFEQAAQSFDATMSEVMPPEGLKAAWEQVQMQAGPFQQKLAATCQMEEGYHIVLLTLRFDRGNLLCRLVYDQQGKLAGLHFRPVD